MTEQPAADNDDGLVPARRTSRRSRRRAASTPPAPSTHAETLTAVLNAVVALQATTDALAEDVRDVRRRVTALSARVESLDQRLIEGEATSRLRTSAAPRKKSATPRKVSGG